MSRILKSSQFSHWDTMTEVNICPRWIDTQLYPQRSISSFKQLFETFLGIVAIMAIGENLTSSPTQPIMTGLGKLRKGSILVASKLRIPSKVNFSINPKSLFGAFLAKLSTFTSNLLILFGSSNYYNCKN